MQSLELTLKTLTPLWTGGVETQMDRIHETGIIGSLRWWYEAIMRGLGGDVCDPTSENPSEQCPREEKYCNVCSVFGATGQGRRFRLRVTVKESINAFWDENTFWDKNLNIRPYGRHRGWYLPPGWLGTATLHLTGQPGALAHMCSLLLFLERWGGLGAKQPLGYGRFAIENREDLLEQQATKDLVQQDSRSVFPNIPGLPNITDFLFYRVQFRPRRPSWWTEIDGLPRQRGKILNALARQGMIPISPVVKNLWRFGQAWPSRSATEWLFGKMDRNGRYQSRVCIGWAIRQDDGTWEIPGWAWLPRPDTKELYRSTETRHQMKTLLSDQALWLKALRLEGEVVSFKITTTTGREAWNEQK